MFICNCNGITEHQVETAINAGCHKPSDIYAGCGTEAKCGRCVDRMLDMLVKMGEVTRPTASVAAE